MRRIVFVIGSRDRLGRLAPVLRKSGEAGLRHDVWLIDDSDVDAGGLARDLGLDSRFSSAGKRAGRTGLGGAHGLWSHVAALTTWTGRQPLVVVFGESGSTVLATLAGRLGGGWIVHLESGASSGSLFDPFPAELYRRLTFGMTNFALCADEASYERMRAYHCKVVQMGARMEAGAATGSAADAAQDAVVAALADWSR